MFLVLVLSLSVAGRCVAVLRCDEYFQDFRSRRRKDARTSPPLTRVFFPFFGIRPFFTPASWS